ncbi:MAG: hypothetical protein V1743_00260 [Nanoarchaeota archaeon]
MSTNQKDKDDDGIPRKKGIGGWRLALLGLSIVGSLALMEKARPFHSISAGYHAAKAGIADRLTTDPGEASEQYLNQLLKADDAAIEKYMPQISRVMGKVYDRLGMENTAEVFSGYLAQDKSTMVRLPQEMSMQLKPDALATVLYNFRAALPESTKDAVDKQYVKAMPNEMKIEDIVNMYSGLPKGRQLAVTVSVLGELTELRPAYNFVKEKLQGANGDGDGISP